MKRYLSTIFILFFSSIAQAEKTLDEVIRSAQQVVIHLPTLNNGQITNSLKMGHNLNIPIRVLTTDDGVMQRNGLLLTLIILDISVFQIPSGGDKRLFLEIETKAGWQAFDLSHGRLIARPMMNYADFNIWYSKNMKRLPKYVPELTTAHWAKAHLGHTLTFTHIQPKNIEQPARLNLPTTP